MRYPANKACVTEGRTSRKQYAPSKFRSKSKAWLGRRCHLNNFKMAASGIIITRATVLNIDVALLQPTMVRYNEKKTKLKMTRKWITTFLRQHLQAPSHIPSPPFS